MDCGDAGKKAFFGKVRPLTQSFTEKDLCIPPRLTAPLLLSLLDRQSSRMDRYPASP